MQPHRAGDLQTAGTRQMKRVLDSSWVALNSCVSCIPGILESSPSLSGGPPEEGCRCHREVDFSISSLSGEKTLPRERIQNTRQESAGDRGLFIPGPRPDSSHLLPWLGYRLHLDVLQPDLSSHLYTHLGVPRAPQNPQSLLATSPCPLLRPHR